MDLDYNFHFFIIIYPYWLPSPKYWVPSIKSQHSVVNIISTWSYLNQTSMENIYKYRILWRALILSSGLRCGPQYEFIIIKDLAVSVCLQRAKGTSHRLRPQKLHGHLKFDISHFWHELYFPIASRASQTWIHPSAASVHVIDIWKWA